MKKRVFLIIICVLSNFLLFAEEPLYIKKIKINGIEKEIKVKYIGKCIYNRDGNIVSLSDKESSSFLVDYDDQGKQKRILKTTNPNGFYWYEYNNEKEEFEVQNAEYEEETFIYDEQGNCIQQIKTKPETKITDYFYDEKGNKIKELIKENEDINTETYYEYDENNNLIHQYGNNSECIFKYDDKNRVVSYILILNGKVYSEFNYEYDDKNNIKIITDEKRGYNYKAKFNSNGNIIFQQEESIIDFRTNKKTFTEQECYYDEKNQLLFSIKKIDNKTIAYYFENYYFEDGKIFYSMKYLIVE